MLSTLFNLLSLLKFLRPGDAFKDTALAAFGYWPALVMQIETGVILGVLNLLVVVIFRAVELRHRMRLDRERAAARRKISDEAD